MKLNILLVVGFSLLFLTQCSNEDILNSPQEQKDFVKTTLHITLPQKSFSRTSTEGYDYDSSKGSLQNLNTGKNYLKIDIAYGPSSALYTGVKDLWKQKGFKLIESTPSIYVEFELLKGISYSFVVTAWSFINQFFDPISYYISLPYYSEDNSEYQGLEVRQVWNDALPEYSAFEEMGLQESKDLFYGYTLWEGQESTHPTVKLTRPLTKVRYVLTDISPEMVMLSRGYPGGDIDEPGDPEPPVIGYSFFFKNIYLEWNLLENSIIRPSESARLPRMVIYDHIQTDSSLSKSEILLFTTYLLLPDCEVPEAKGNTYHPILASSYIFPSFSLKGKTDSKGNTITSLANKLVTIKQSAVARGKFRVEVEDIFD